MDTKQDIQHVVGFIRLGVTIPPAALLIFNFQRLGFI
jgi:hypothetical protein